MILRDFLSFFDFEYKKIMYKENEDSAEKVVYKLIDTTGVNLGNIESEVFYDIVCIVDRLDIYYHDYIYGSISKKDWSGHPDNLYSGEEDYHEILKWLRDNETDYSGYIPIVECIVNPDLISEESLNYKIIGKCIFGNGEVDENGQMVDLSQFYEPYDFSNYLTGDSNVGVIAVSVALDYGAKEICSIECDLGIIKIYKILDRWGGLLKTYDGYTFYGEKLFKNTISPVAIVIYFNKLTSFLEGGNDYDIF